MVRLSELLRDEMLAGIEMASDPLNAGLALLLRRQTTLESAWFAASCGYCHLKVREGDWVRVCPDCGQAYHDDERYEFDCWRRKVATGEVCKVGGVDEFDEDVVEPSCDYVWPRSLLDEPLEKEQQSEQAPSERFMRYFLGGLSKVELSFGNQSMIKVPRDSVLRGRPCPYCRYSIRIGDWVVECPCGCGTYFHQDLFRHLSCWNDWNGSKGKTHCLNTSRPFPKTKQGGEAAHVE